jgi:hypothetical protein
VKAKHFVYIALAAFVGYVGYRHFVTKTPMFPQYGI